jgi:ribosomal 50S subunit-recycling heat shock protein
MMMQYCRIYKRRSLAKESGKRMHIKFERINNKLIGEDDENIKNCNKKQSVLEMKHVVL